MSPQVGIPAVRTIVMPKVDHEDHLGRIEQGISRALQCNNELLHQRPEPLSIVASIESAQALWRIGEIAKWESKYARLSALLVRLNPLSIAIFEDSLSRQFAAEDCTRKFI
jgi:citrate lyase beta subunit